MGPETDDISVFILWLAWVCLSTTNRALKNLNLDLVFPTERAMEKIMQISPLQFAAGLLQIFQSPTAPTIAYFKTLPLYLDKLWAVYLLVLEKAGERPRIYIGSGTSAEGGVRRRMTTYDRRSDTGEPQSTISEYVETSLQEGYAITHKCLLAWTPLPLPSDRYELRCLFLVLETICTLCFWAMKSREKDYYMPALCPWPRHSFTYDGCCTHFSINEQIMGQNEKATPEEINRVAAERKAVKSRLYIANKGPGVHKANTKAYGEKALEEKRYQCTVCDLTFRSNARLLLHLNAPIHIRKAAGISNRKTTRGGSQIAVAKKKYWCETCQHAAATAERLETHLKGPRHAKKLRDLASSSKLD